MKEIAVLVILMILAVGCISEEEETPETPPPPPETTPTVTTPPQTTTPVPTTSAPQTTPPPTTKTSTLGEAFNPVYRDKMWSTYTYIAEGQESQMTIKMFDDDDMYVFEYEIEAEGMAIVAQMWLDKSGESPYECDPIKYIVKMMGVVYCIDTKTFPDPTESYTPEGYAEYAVIREDTYTMPTGKTVKVFIVTDGKNEIWFSEEVPFSVVKVIVDGELAVVLIDFGFDAERKISREEGEQCIPIPTP